MARSLDDLPKKVKRAAGEGLVQGGNKVRTDVRKALKLQTGARSYAVITKRVTSFAPVMGLSYTIRGIGIPMKIPEEVPARGGRGKAWLRYSRREHWKLQRRGRDGKFGRIKEVAAVVTGFPWKVAHRFKRSFVGPMGMRAAIPNGRGFRMRKLYGPNVAEELPKGQSIVAFNTGVSTHVIPAVEAKLGRLSI